MSEGDAVKVVADLLSGAWSGARTDYVTPKFYLSGEQPMRLDYTFSTETNLLFYPASHTIKPNDLGASYKEETNDLVSIDIRTKKSRSHQRNCYLEAKRIVGLNTNNPHADFPYLESVQDTVFPSIGFWRSVYDVKLKHWTVAK